MGAFRGSNGAPIDNPAHQCVAEVFRPEARPLLGRMIATLDDITEGPSRKPREQPLAEGSEGAFDMRPHGRRASDGALDVSTEVIDAIREVVRLERRTVVGDNQFDAGVLYRIAYEV